jgi:hypothetical protein
MSFIGETISQRPCIVQKRFKKYVFVSEKKNNEKQKKQKEKKRAETGRDTFPAT